MYKKMNVAIKKREKTEQNITLILFSVLYEAGSCYMEEF